MSSFDITGGRQLHGEITPQGAKNEALQAVCACLLTSEKVTIHNVPDIRDVNKLIELLGTLGVDISRSGSSATFKAGEINFDFLIFLLGYALVVAERFNRGNLGSVARGNEAGNRAHPYREYNYANRDLE